jgi:hypothetical protein
VGLALAWCSSRSANDFIHVELGASCWLLCIEMLNWPTVGFEEILDRERYTLEPMKNYVKSANSRWRRALRLLVRDVHMHDAPHGISVCMIMR